MTKEDEKLYRLVDELERAEKRTEGGEAILYLTKKIEERAKREMIEKAEKWLSNNMFNSINNGVIINGYCVSDFVGRFKYAMQDESK